MTFSSLFVQSKTFLEPTYKNFTLHSSEKKFMGGVWERFSEDKHLGSRIHYWLHCSVWNLYKTLSSSKFRLSLIEKDLVAGKDWRQREKSVGGWGWDGYIASLTQWSKVQKIVKDRGAWRAVVHGVSKSQIWLNNWTTFVK